MKKLSLLNRILLVVGLLFTASMLSILTFVSSSFSPTSNQTAQLVTSTRVINTDTQPIFLSLSREGGSTSGDSSVGSFPSRLDVFGKYIFGESNALQSYDAGSSYVDVWKRDMFDFVEHANDDNHPDAIIASNQNTVKAFSGKDGSILWQKTFTDSIKNLKGLGDIDGNGYSDFGVYHENVGGMYGVYVYSGLNGSYIGKAVTSDFQYGIDFGGIDDVNGDGRDELLVGSPRYDNPSYSGSLEGKIEMHRFNGTPGSGSFQLLSSIKGTLDLELVGSGKLQGLGDVNGDGKPDFYNEVTASAGSGNPHEITIYSYNNGNIVETKQIPTNNTWTSTGLSFATSADVDGDGKDELIVSYWTNIFGHIDIYDNDLTTVLWSKNPEINPGINNSGYFGKYIINVGDLTGDGKEEIAVSQYSRNATYNPDFNGSGVNFAGAVFIFDIAQNKVIQRYYGLQDGYGLGLKLAPVTN